MRRINFVESMELLSGLALDCAVMAEGMDSKDGSEEILGKAKDIFSRAQRSMIACYKSGGEEFKLINFNAHKKLHATRNNFKGDFKLLLTTKAHEMKNEATKHFEVKSVMHNSGKVWRKNDTDAKRFTEIAAAADAILDIVS